MFNRLGVDHQCDGRTDRQTYGQTDSVAIAQGRMPGTFIIINIINIDD